jgi:hypothetical protein
MMRAGQKLAQQLRQTNLQLQTVLLRLIYGLEQEVLAR